MPPGTPDSNAQLAEMIKSMKEEIVKEVDGRFTGLRGELDDRLKPVAEISQTLDAARRQQAEAYNRQQQQQRPAAQVPASWDEVYGRMGQIASEAIKKGFDERDTNARQQTERQTNEEREMEAEIDGQLNNLQETGYLPPVGNPNDYNDPGVATRRELLAAASFLGTPDLPAVAKTLATMHQQDKVFDSNTKEFVSAAGSLTPLPGKFAPVGNSGQRSSSGAGGPSYKQIHEARDFDSLMDLAQRQGYGPLPTVSDTDTGF